VIKKSGGGEGLTGYPSFGKTVAIRVASQRAFRHELRTTTTRIESQTVSHYHETDDEPSRPDPQRKIPTLPRLAWMERRASAFWDARAGDLETELAERKRRSGENT
jgi:hypothetical protein